MIKRIESNYFKAEIKIFNGYYTTIFSNLKCDDESKRHVIQPDTLNELKDLYELLKVCQYAWGVKSKDD